MTDTKRGALTPEQVEAAILLKNVWDNRKKEWKFTQYDAESETGIKQSSISSYLNGRYGMGPLTVIKFAKFLRVPASTIMPSLAYLDSEKAELAIIDVPGDLKYFAPLLEKDHAEGWVEGALTYSCLPPSTTKIPIFESWTGKRCFAVMASTYDAAAIKDIKQSDILICDPTRRPGEDELGFYRISDQWTLGYLQRHAGKWVLTFDNFDPIQLEDEDSTRICTIMATYRLSKPSLKKALA